MNKKKMFNIGIIAFLFIVSFSLLSYYSSADNSKSGGCSACHVTTSDISLTVINGSTINVNKGTSFNITLYASCQGTLAGGNDLTIRFFNINPTGLLTFTPSMLEADSGVSDGSVNDPDTAPDKVGNATHPVIIEVTNVPSTDQTIKFSIIAADGDGSPKMASIQVTIIIGAGSTIETPLEWFIRTQVPLIILIIVICSIGIVLSVVLKPLVEKAMDNKKAEKTEKLTKNK